MKPLLSLLTAAVMSSPAPAFADVTKATFSGLMVGEIVCSMMRANVKLTLVEREVRRVTDNLYTADLLVKSDEPLFKSSIKKVIEACPKENS